MRQIRTHHDPALRPRGRSRIVNDSIDGRDKMGKIIGECFATTSAMLMGRRLYDDWSVYCPEHGDDDFGRSSNGLPTYVVSNSHDEATWQNTTLIRNHRAVAAARRAT